MSTKNVLAALSSANQYVTLAIELGGEIVPLAKGLVKEIRSIGEKKETTYQILLQTDGAELDAVHQLAEDDLAAINAELAKMGKDPIPRPVP